MKKININCELGNFDLSKNNKNIIMGRRKTNTRQAGLTNGGKIKK